MTKKQAIITALREAKKSPRVIAKASARDADRANHMVFISLLILSLSFLLLLLLP